MAASSSGARARRRAAALARAARPRARGAVRVLGRLGVRRRRARPRPTRVAKKTSKASVEGGECVSSFTSVAASDAFTRARSEQVDRPRWRARRRRARSSTPGCPRRAARRRSRRAGPSIRPGPPSSSLVALSMSRLVLEQDVQRLGDASSSPISSRPSTTSVRAQSRVSETDGAFFRSSSRSERTTCGDLLGQGAARCPGTRCDDDVALALDVGVADVQVEAAPLERLGELAGVVRREEDHRDLVARASCRARGSRPGTPRGSRGAAPRSRARRGRPRR